MHIKVFDTLRKNMATTEIIAAIELGSSKLIGIAGRRNSDSSMQILAYAAEESSSFIRKGIIYNLDKTAQALTTIIKNLEQQLDKTIAKVYVGMNGQSLHSIKHSVVRNLDEEIIITQELIDSICDENLESALPNMEILDVVPQEYKLGNNFQFDPVGVASSQVIGNFLNIVARNAIKKKIENTFAQANIEIADCLIAPLVTANAALTENECKLGCALIDFGADTTTVSIYKNNVLRFITVIPLGGSNITRDILSLKVEEDEAEHLKLAYGNVMYVEETTDTPAMHQLDDGTRSIEINLLNNVIEARADEIILNVWNQIQLSGYDDKLLAGMVITGGGANLKNIDSLLRKKSKIEKVRFAKTVQTPIQADGTGLVLDGSQNSILGLLLAGQEPCCAIKPIVVEKPQPAPSTLDVGTLFADDEEYKRQEEAARVAAQATKKVETKPKTKAEKTKSNGPTWLEKTIGKITKEIFSDEDMN